MGLMKYAHTDSESESESKATVAKDPPRNGTLRSVPRRAPARRRSVGTKLTPRTRAGKTPKFDTTPPSEWTIDQVVEWLKSKRFGNDVCDKFIEQDITGDALLELDVHILKAEIGIEAFGKRTRIANAIAKLCCPSSNIPPAQLPRRAGSISRSVSLSLENPNAKTSTSPLAPKRMSSFSTDGTIVNEICLENDVHGEVRITSCGLGFETC